MKKHILPSLHFITAALCFATAIIWLADGNSALTFLWLCCGSCNLCTAAIRLNQAKKAEKETEINQPKNGESPEKEKIS